jgi:mRNA interferase RelE/StbE
MIYTVSFHKTTTKFLEKIPEKDKESILTKIYELSCGSEHLDIKKLQSLDEYRLRVGKYRIIYEKINSVFRIFIISIGHRKDIYK